MLHLLKPKYLQPIYLSSYSFVNQSLNISVPPNTPDNDKYLSKDLDEEIDRIIWVGYNPANIVRILSESINFVRKNDTTYCIRTLLFWFDEDDDNLRYHSLISSSGAAAISKRYPIVHAASLSIPGGPSANQFGDEANIAYLAFTRAIRDPYLPNLKRFISGSKK
jgi:hypothetical protein